MKKIIKNFEEFFEIFLKNILKNISLKAIPKVGECSLCYLVCIHWEKTKLSFPLE
jgi:hypothetical protein